MPRNFWLFSVRRTTTIILMDSSNLNVIQGDLRHMDWSTSITNRDAFNVESTAGQPSRSITFQVPTPLVPRNPSTELNDQDTNREMPSNLQCTQYSLPIEAHSMTSSPTVEDPSPPHHQQSFTEALKPTRQIKKNKFTFVCQKIKDWIKRVL